ncbi:protein LAZY 1 [Sesamum alatum]|uniref:Protein LAZY 1 n=1 Tax=Sesamum alatum TaxID=300844 RepID=A0AAE1Y950_9LAMI|nr:protein LAZY 1 [Sesamum alatum]
MKLLGWMHRKLKHNTTDHPIKTSTLAGNLSACVSVETQSDEQNYYTEPTYKTFSHPNIKRKRCSNIFEASFLQEEESFEPFEFLSIGTFGMEMELLNTDPPTPTLPTIEITENDLNLINYELEKFLEAEETAEVENDTSGRSSQASIITLSYIKPIEAAGTQGHVHMVACPLQSYLFAASVEVANNTDKEVAKKERTSLEDLFKRNNIVHDDPPVTKCEGPQHKARTRNVAHFMKKVVNKFHSSSTNDTASGNKAIKEKLSKSLVKMFHKKVYPEEMSEKQFIKLAKGKKKNNGSNKTEESGSKKSKKKKTKLCWNGICRGASPVDGGHWIKTDSDYLVLEL